MSSFDLKSRLGNLVGDCSTYKSVETLFAKTDDSDYDTRGLVEPGRALTAKEIKALLSAHSVLK